MKRHIIYFLIGLVLFVSANAESLTVSHPHGSPRRNEPQWERYTARREEFTALFPEQPSVLFLGSHYVNIEYRYAAYSDGTVYTVTSLNNTTPKYPLQVHINNRKFESPETELIFKRELTNSGFAGKQYSIRMSNGVEGVISFFATKERVYIVEAVGANDADPAVQRFIDSFTLGNKTAAKDIGKGARAEEQKASAVENAKPIYTRQQVMRGAVIVAQPVNLTTPKAIKNKTSGTVVIKAVLRPTGVVTNIEVVSGLPDGLTESAVESTRKTYFIPALKDGTRVSQSIQFEYVFAKIR